METRILKPIITGIITCVIWMIVSKYVGFETTVLIALATIYGYQK